MIEYSTTLFDYHNFQNVKKYFKNSVSKYGNYLNKENDSDLKTKQKIMTNSVILHR